MKEIILHYTQYNLWANKKFVDLLKQVELVLLDREAKSSFSSIRKTMQHIWGAEEIWYKRLNGEPPSAFPQPDDDFYEFIKKCLARSESFIDLIQGWNENHLQAVRSYKDLRGNSHANNYWHMVMHCMNHSTFHRGQVVTMLRGVDETSIPATDMIVFLREKEKKS